MQLQDALPIPKLYIGVDVRNLFLKKNPENKILDIRHRKISLEGTVQIRHLRPQLRQL
ncbi:MAG: hypothetical protein RL660_1440 [Bacteroidota bacterium]|jgi:hypothetical protein